MHEAGGIGEGQGLRGGSKAEHLIHRARPDELAAFQIEVPKAAATAGQRRFDAQVGFEEGIVRVARPLHLVEVGVEDDEKDHRDAGEERDVEREFAAPEVFDRLKRMGGDDHRSIGADWREDRVMQDAVKIGLDRAGAAAGLADGHDLGQEARQHQADLGCSLGRGSEDTASGIDEKDEGAVREMLAIEKEREALFGLSAVARFKQLRTLAECGIHRCRNERRRLADCGLHALVLVDDADRPGKRHDSEEGQDQDGNGPAQYRLDAP